MKSHHWHGLKAATTVKTRYGSNESSQEVAAAMSVEELVVAEATQGHHVKVTMAWMMKGRVDWKTPGMLTVADAYGGELATVSLCLE
jgi:hypothetical protein